MSNRAAPSIPPRPSRSPQKASSLPHDSPVIPPFQTRRSERSNSPNPLGSSYAPSPLNDIPGTQPVRQPSPECSRPLRTPSVQQMPSVGQEGMEYAELDYQKASDHEEEQEEPAQLKSVKSDLQIFAPRPSLPKASTRAQVEDMARAVSQHSERPTRRTWSKDHSRTTSSVASHDSLDTHDTGLQVPMDPNAGDVQAPTPTDSAAQARSKSKCGRESVLPPGSYGLHGHGVTPNDSFEKAWYEKHPDEFKREVLGQHLPASERPRPTSALSGDDLNKLVRSSADKGSGLATTNYMSTPDEETGYIATEELAGRLSSSPPHSNASAKTPQPRTRSPSKAVRGHSEPKRGESLVEDGGIHIEDHPPSRDAYHESPVPDETADDPILPSDEVDPAADHLHPVISPTAERSENGVSTRSNSRSHPSSRPPSILYSKSRDEIMKPLEEVHEYEPLFPTSDDHKPDLADRFKKRPDMQQRFPSQDVWEDQPNSLHFQAAVSTPEVPADTKASGFEPPEEEEKRIEKAESPEVENDTTSSYLEETRKGNHATKKRFPSNDVWEDAPDSSQLLTTVESPQQPERKEERTEPASVPSIPTSSVKRIGHLPSAPTEKSTVPSSSIQASTAETRQPPSVPARPKPQVPARPSRPVRKPDSMSDKPAASTDHADSREAEAVKNQASVPAPPTKPKPAVPSRPVGSKIAALRAGFLSDLDSRLKVGPHVPPKPQKIEEEKEKAPLSDARKSRARGPARRKPAPAATVTEPEKSAVRAPKFAVVDAFSVFHIGKNGLSVFTKDKKSFDDEHNVTESKPIPNINNDKPQLGESILTSPKSEQHTGSADSEAVAPSPEPNAKTALEPETSTAPTPATDIPPGPEKTPEAVPSSAESTVDESTTTKTHFPAPVTDEAGLKSIPEPKLEKSPDERNALSETPAASEDSAPIMRETSLDESDTTEDME